MRKGFTILEMMLVIGILVILASSVVPLFGQLQLISGIDSTKQEMVADFRLAQRQAAAGTYGEGAGLYIATSSYAIYSGPSYAERNQSYDVVREMTSFITTTGFSDMHFARYTGFPISTSSLVIIDTRTNTTDTIHIDTYGAIY